MENVWLTRAKRLQAIASTGLHFTNDPFDRDRYAELAEIAHAMLSDLGQVPIERIVGLVPDFAKAYPTPKVDVRGAVVEDGRVLLVRERSDGRWSLPGGFADIGFSAAENVAKEVREEAGIAVDVRALYSVRHKARQDYEPDARDFYKLLFLCTRADDAALRPGSETIDVGFFAEHALPELSRGRTNEADIRAALAAERDGRGLLTFD